MTAVQDSQEAQELLLQLYNPANRSDPYPIYQEIRQRGRLHIPENHCIVVSSYQDCDEVLRHPSSSSDRMKSTPAQQQISEGAVARPLGPPGFLFLDPPDHTRLRGLVSKAFVPKVVRALEPDITKLVDDLLDKAADAGEFEVIADLAYPLPVAVICRLLGVPLEDEPEFSKASALLAQSLDPFQGDDDSEQFEQRMAAGRWLRQYLRDLIERRRSDPGDDLMSALVRVEEAGDQLTEDEIVATCNLLLIAGHETTVNLIANAVLAMLRQPEQWAALVAEPSRVAAVVEETLRYDPPVQLAARTALDDMVIGDSTIPKGDVIMLLLAASHRDPAMFDRPDVFDPDRETIRHLGFGRGPHFCLGAPLARLEAAVALTAVTKRFPQARLAAEPEYKPNLTLRGMARLEVAV